MINKILLTLGLLLLSSSVYAENNETEKLQDMSDPLAVFTQGGFGITDKGLNLKIGKAYDSGKPATMAMNVVEIKGIFGETLGYRGSSQVDSIDSIRFRNFTINTKTGLGAQVDATWDFNNDTGSASYSLIQGLPKLLDTFQFYPLAGLGFAVANNVNENPLWKEDDNSSSSGLSVPGVYAQVGMYSRIIITKKLWLNYNPVWLKAIGGSDAYNRNAYGKDNDSLFTHEAAISYQISPRFNVRYFANWSDEVDFSDGDQRIECNYQF